MDESTKNLLKSAQAGKSWAQYNLGLRYSKGKGVEQDYVQAVYWYRKAAQQGDPDAQINLGFRYAHGEGVEKDDVEAVRWYNKAAQQGHPRGQFNLGFRYAKGRGIEQDDVEAVRWYNKAAQQGHASAQSNLGLMYEKGKGVDQDYVEAVKWYRKAANQGHLRGQYNLADMYEQGKGVAKDLAVAWELYQSAKSEIESADKATERLKDDEACLEARKKVRHVLIHRRDDESKWQALLRDKEESGVTHPLNSYMNQNESRSNTSKDSKDSTNSKDSKDSKDSTIHSTSHSKSAHVKQVAGTAEDINQIKREMQKEYEKKLQYSKQQQRRVPLQAELRSGLNRWRSGRRGLPRSGCVGSVARCGE